MLDNIFFFLFFKAHTPHFNEVVQVVREVEMSALTAAAHSKLRNMILRTITMVQSYMQGKGIVIIITDEIYLNNDNTVVVVVVL